MSTIMVLVYMLSYCSQTGGGGEVMVWFEE